MKLGRILRRHSHDSKLPHPSTLLSTSRHRPAFSTDRKQHNPLKPLGRRSIDIIHFFIVVIVSSFVGFV